MRLDTTNWKTFNINRLFIVEAGKYYYSDEYTNGETPYCSASAENNGISKKIDLPPDFKGNQIVTGKVGCTTFYEPNPFCATSDVNILTPRFKMSPLIGLFITTILNKSENYRWNYGRQCRVGNMKKINIKLPVLCDKYGDCIFDDNKKYSDYGYIPDFKFMDDYIKTLHYKPVTTTNYEVDYSHTFGMNVWKDYRLGDLFNIKKGKRLTSDDQTEGKTPYVGAIDSNNGISNYIGQTPIHEGNTITLSYNGSVGEAFYQPIPFWATDDVNVLYFRKENNYEFNKYIALFICTILRQEKYRYCYGRKWILESMEKTRILLPSKNGNPDWEWMESYIKSLPYSDRI